MQDWVDSAFSSECVILPCDVAHASVQKDLVASRVSEEACACLCGRCVVVHESWLVDEHWKVPKTKEHGIT